MTINTQKEETIDFHAIIDNYIKHWYLFLIATILAVGIAFVYIKITAPIYQISANILIKEEEGGSGASGMQSALMKNMGFGMLGKSNVDDEVEIVSSFSLFQDAVKSLELNKTYVEKKWFGLKRISRYTDTPITINVAESIQDTLTKAIIFNLNVNKKGEITVRGKVERKSIGKVEAKAFPLLFKSKYGDFVFNETPIYAKGKSLSMKIVLQGYSPATEFWRQNVVVALTNKRSNAIAISTQDTHIIRGKALLNKIIEIYNYDGINDKNIVAQNTANFLTDRLAIISKDLSIAENSVEKYKKDNQLTDLTSEAKIVLEKNADFKEKQLDVETQYSIIELIEKYIQNPQNKYALIPTSLGIDNKSLAEALQTYNALLLERMKLQRSSNDNNPMLQSLTQQVDAMRANLLLSVEGMKANVNIMRADFRKQESTFMQRIQNMPRQEREYVDIKRQQAIKEQLYVFLLEKREENDLTLAVTAPKAKIIDAAYNLNDPLSPRKIVILLIALCLGIGLPIIYLYLRDLLNNKFATKEELEKLTTLPVLGEICQNKGSEVLVVKAENTSAIVELFRLIRTNMSFIINGETEKVILVTSTRSGEGKSFFACNFALSMALLGKKVALVGLDIRSPRLMAYLNLPMRHIGISNYLSNNTTTIEDINILTSLHPNLTVIPAGPIPPNPGELLLSSRLDELFSYLRSEYDYIIIDSAPVGMVSDTFNLVRVSDATIYITRANYTEKSSIKYLNNLVMHNRLKKVSLVANGTKGHMGYGYGYSNNKKTY